MAYPFLFLNHSHITWGTPVVDLLSCGRRLGAVQTRTVKAEGMILSPGAPGSVGSLWKPPIESSTHTTDVPQELLKYAIPIYSGALTFFPLDCQIKKMTSANTTMAVWLSESKLYLFFCQIGKKHILGCAAEL